VLGLMIMAIGVARLIEVELGPEKPTMNVAPTKSSALASPVAQAPPQATPAVSLATEATPAPKPAERAYTVKDGDTLGTISKTVYGSTKHWQVIQSANPDVDPRRMRPGVRLTIPRLEPR